MNLNEEQVALHYKLLGHEGLGFTEVRAFSQTGYIAQRYVDSETDFVAAVRELHNAQSKAIYVGVNPRNKKDGKEENVDYVTSLFYDIDPVRAKDTASTEEQHNEALAIAEVVKQADSKCTFIDSGSGLHIYKPVVPYFVSKADKENTKEILKALEEQFRVTYGNKTNRVDHTFDFPRVARVAGSWNNRSNRPCVLIGIPSSVRADFTVIREGVKNVITRPAIVAIQGEETSQAFKRFITLNKEAREIFTKEKDFESRSESDYAFVRLMVKAGFSLGDIRKYAQLNPSGRQADMEKGDIERIVKKVVESNGIGTKSLIHGFKAYEKTLNSRASGFGIGFPNTDRMFGRLKKKEMLIIAARPAEGKTTLSTQIAEYLAKQNHKTLIFPTELSGEVLFDKIISRNTSIDLNRFREGNFTEAELKKINGVREYVSSLPLVVAEHPSPDLGFIQRKVEDTVPDIMIVDYAQSTEGADDPKTLNQFVMGLRILIDKWDIPVILMSQRNRGSVDGEPKMSDMKGGGSLEEKPDHAIFLNSVNQMSYPRKSMFSIMKARFGEVGRIPLDFYAKEAKFIEATA